MSACAEVNPEMREKNEDDQQRAYAYAGSSGQDAQTTTGVFCRGGPQLVQGNDQVKDDAEQIEKIEDIVGIIAQRGQQRAIAAAVIVGINCRKKDADARGQGQQDDPLDPWRAGVDAGAFRKIDSEEQEGG